MKKLVSLFLVFILMISSVPFAAVAEGEDEYIPDAALEQTEEAAAEEPAAEEPVIEEPAVEEPQAEELTTEEPVTEEPLAEESVAEESVAEESVAEEPQAEEPVVEEPVAEEPVIEEPAAEEPVVEEPVAEEPVVEEPVAEEPVVEEPAAKEPVAEEPVVEEPAAEEPAAEEPVAEEPAAEEPVVEEPVIEEPVAEEPAAEEPAAEEPAAEELAAEEPVVEEPVIEEPAAEEPVIEEPAAEESVAEEPVAEEPVAEEPVAEEPVVEEPAVEVPAADEPAEEEAPAEAETPVEEEVPVHFEKGYLLVKRKTTVYAENKSTKIGKFTDYAVVYGISAVQNDDPADDWLKIFFAVENDGIAKPAEGFIQARRAQELTDEKAAQLTAGLGDDSPACQGNKLPTVSFTAAGKKAGKAAEAEAPAALAAPAEAEIKEAPKPETKKAAKKAATVGQDPSLKMTKTDISMAADGYWELSWKRVKNADGYFVYRKTAPANSFPSTPHEVISSGETCRYTDKRVEAGKTYTYLVVPFRKSGKTKDPGTCGNEVKCFVGLGRVKITGVSQDDTDVTLKWKPVSRAKGYEIYMLKGSKWVRIATVEGRKHTTYKHHVPVTRERSGKTLEYKVRAIGRLGSETIGGEMSYKRTIRRLASPGPITLKQSGAEDFVTVRWQKVKGAEKYYIYYRQSGEEKYRKKKVSGTKTSAAIKVTGTKEHDVYVVACGDGSSSQETAVQQIQPYWYYVLLVGEYEYQVMNCSDLPAMKYDVEGMYKVFSKQTTHVTKKFNVTANGMRSAISGAFGSAGPNSVCVLMFAGHGMTGDSELTTASLCFSDGSSITPGALKNYMDRNVKSEHVVIMLGSCGSGGFIQSNGSRSEPREAGYDADAFNSAFINVFSGCIRSNSAEFLYSKKYTVITAAMVHEEGICWNYGNPFLNYWPNGYSEIFRHIAAAGGYEYCDNRGKETGWIGKQGDANGDRKISVKEAYDYARLRVEKSHPQFWSSEPELILFQ